MHKWHDVRGCRNSERAHWFQQGQGIEGASIPVYHLASNLHFYTLWCNTWVWANHISALPSAPGETLHVVGSKGAWKTRGGKRDLLLVVRLVLTSCLLSVSIPAIPAGPLLSVPVVAIDSGFQFLQGSHNKPHYTHSKNQATVSQCLPTPTSEFRN